MEMVGIVERLAKALWNLKVACDQHKVNKSEAKELQDFIQDLQEWIPALEKRSKEGHGINNNLGNLMLKKLAKDTNEAIDKLDKWSADRSFFRVLNAHDRKQELESMHLKVMSSIQKNLAIASVSILLNVQTSQSTIIEQTTEMNALLTASIASSRAGLLPKVRAEVVEASRSPFADEKFWHDVLAAIDSRHDDASAASRSAQNVNNLYEDPITFELMVDPVVASNGHTYCRWTIIDNDMTRDPSNPEEDMAIVVDNLVIRTGLFEAFPEQFVKFQQRRHEYRCGALSLARKEKFGDAELALQNVLRWNRNDEECAQVLAQVKGELEKGKGKDYVEPSSVSSMDQMFDYPTEPSSMEMETVGCSRAHQPSPINMKMKTVGYSPAHLPSPMNMKMKTVGYSPAHLPNPMNMNMKTVGYSPVHQPSPINMKMKTVGYSPAHQPSPMMETKTVTHPLVLVDDSSLAPGPRSSIPNWLSIPFEEATEIRFKFPHSLEKLFQIVGTPDRVLEREVKWKKLVQVAPYPFSGDGNRRWPSYAKLNGRKMVVKRFKAPLGYTTNEAYLEQMELQTVAAFMATEFNRELDSTSKFKMPDFTRVTTLEIGLWNGPKKVYNMEEYRCGKWIRYSNNVNYVATQDYAAIFHAFTHWTHERSQGVVMVTNLCCFIGDDNVFSLYKATVHCRDIVRYERTGTNLGEPAMRQFLQTHQCNIVCRSLGLLKTPTVEDALPMGPHKEFGAVRSAPP